MSELICVIFSLDQKVLINMKKETTHNEFHNRLASSSFKKIFFLSFGNLGDKTGPAQGRPGPGRAGPGLDMAGPGGPGPSFQRAGPKLGRPGPAHVQV